MDSCPDFHLGSVSLSSRSSCFMHTNTQNTAEDHTRSPFPSHMTCVLPTCERTVQQKITVMSSASFSE